MIEATLESIKEAVKTQIKETVNGKIDDIKIHLVKQDSKLEEMGIKQEGQDKKLEIIGEKLDELAPIIETKRAFNSIRKFVVWIATPATLFWGAYKFLVK
jgi:hypothetical protein